jgi:hypothetical protein
VYDESWSPFITQLQADPQKLSAEREPMPDRDAVAVLCPIRGRTKHITPLIESFKRYTDDGEASLCFIIEPDDDESMRLIGWEDENIYWVDSDGLTCAEKWNDGYAETEESWVLCIGDDVRFHAGWLDAARKLSGEYDVIGTNDSLPGRVRNPKVANGSHSDHTFFRRAYVEEHGACLDGPGVLAPEAYAHWFTDVEMVRLSKARGVFTPCLDCVIEHLHPGYDGDEEARLADSTYMLAVDSAVEDEETFRSRLPLIEMARTSRGRN